MPDELTPEMLVAGYCHGIFPMADPDRGNEILWFRPNPRAILPLDRLHVPRNLRKLVRRGTFSLSDDRAFAEVMASCGARESTWISDEIVSAYTQLHRIGIAHSIEVWQEGQLVGGLYGVALGGAFFGESMFHRVTDASKVGLVHLVDRLREKGFVLLDVQYQTPHLSQFGVIEISAEEYEERLAAALALDVDW